MSAELAQLASIQTVAEKLAVSESFVKRLVDCGKLQAVRLKKPMGKTTRGRWRIYVESVQEYLGKLAPKQRTVKDDEQQLHRALAALGIDRDGGK